MTRLSENGRTPGCETAHTIEMTCAAAIRARAAADDPTGDPTFGHDTGCAGWHTEGLTCSEVTRIRAEHRERHARWECPNNPRPPLAHNFGFADADTFLDDADAVCLYGCGMTWGRLRDDDGC